MGLTSEEEERHGVAASLLGPLIPSEIKEAEEKWRKKLLTNVDEPGNSLDSDGEGVLPTGSPAPPPQDADSALNVQKDVSVKKQSGENTEAEEETEEDTMELELALERKKVGGCLCATRGIPQAVSQCTTEVDEHYYWHDVAPTCRPLPRLSYAHWRKAMAAQGDLVLAPRPAKKPLVPEAFC